MHHYLKTQLYQQKTQRYKEIMEKLSLPDLSELQRLELEKQAHTLYCALQS